MNTPKITVEVQVAAPISRVWAAYTTTLSANAAR